jgi:hypothetical protein
MATERDDERRASESPLMSTLFIIAVLAVVLGLGVWLFNQIEVPSLSDASRAPTTTPVPKDPGGQIVPKTGWSPAAYR